MSDIKFCCRTCGSGVLFETMTDVVVESCCRMSEEFGIDYHYQTNDGGVVEHYQCENGHILKYDEDVIVDPDDVIEYCKETNRMLAMKEEGYTG